MTLLYKSNYNVIIRIGIMKRYFSFIKKKIKIIILNIIFFGLIVRKIFKKVS